MPKAVDRLLFGGSFDPPHRGHLEILRYVLRKNLAHYVDIVPAALSPFKEAQPPCASALDRLAMLKRLVKHLDKQSLGKGRLGLLELELKREGPSYTADTCRFLRSEFYGQKIAILIGADSLEGLELWDRIEDILNHHSFWVFLRNTMPKPKLEKSYRKIRSLFPQSHIEILWDSPLLSCSSSEIRRHLGLSAKAEALDCLLTEIWEYIQRKKLYQNERHI